MKIHTYKDYAEYRKVQTHANLQKLGHSWATKDHIRFLAGYLQGKVTPIHFGLCHGTRRGLEQAWFREFLGVEVVGTEISPTATQFPHTIQWDFHEVKDEWLGAVDFIYSNALDHSYDPQKCLASWMQCIRPGGVCLIEWSKNHVESSSMDPFGATLEEYREMVSREFQLLDELQGLKIAVGEPVHVLVVGHRTP